jgi:zinc transporter ZupT
MVHDSIQAVASTFFSTALAAATAMTLGIGIQNFLGGAALSMLLHGEGMS